VHWTLRGTIFSQATKPRWADKDFWAPEIHRVGDHYIAYYSARQPDGTLAIGAASSSSVLGPYADSGAPLVRDSRGAINPHQFEAPDGTSYLIWKVDGNASAATTPINIQPLTADGLALTGSPTTLLTNTQQWEGRLIQAPWLIFNEGYYYLFYNADDSMSDGSAVAVARAMTVTGPYTRAPAPILASGGGWAGPGMGSVLRSPSGGWVALFHALKMDPVDQSTPERRVLLTRVGWVDGWPTMLGAPSSLSQPLP
jgi:beta-xylosidase